MSFIGYVYNLMQHRIQLNIQHEQMEPVYNIDIFV